MLPRRIAYVLHDEDEAVLESLLADFAVSGKIKYEVFNYFPDRLVLEHFDGFIIFGMGDSDLHPDPIVADFRRNPPGIPGIYVYTLDKPAAPNLETLEAPFRLGKFVSLFEKVFALSGTG